MTCSQSNTIFPIKLTVRSNCQFEFGSPVNPDFLSWEPKSFRFAYLVFSLIMKKSISTVEKTAMNKDSGWIMGKIAVIGEILAIISSKKSK